MASEALPGRGVLAFRALLALLLGATGFFMLVLVFLFPRTTTVLIVRFFAVYTLLDGLLCIIAGARAMSKALPRLLLVLEGLVEVATGIAVFVLLRGLGERPRGGILLLIAVWALATGVLQLAWTFSVDIRRGRLLLAITAAVSVAFGLFVLSSAPPDLLTAVWRLAVFVLLIGVLRVVLTFRLQRASSASR